MRHEAPLLLFRNHPELVAKLLRGALGVKVPRYTEARLDSAELTDVQPAEYRADMVVQLFARKAVLGVVVEVQLRRDSDKHYAWPAYVANLRSRLKCPVALLVVVPNKSMARWARKPIHLGGGSHFVPLVLDLARVPCVTDEAQARADPELAVLSAMAHGRDTNSNRSAQVADAALRAIQDLDLERAGIYYDLIMNALGKATRRSLRAMKLADYKPQSDIVRGWWTKGRVEGQVEGRADLLARLLTRRFGALQDDTRARLAASSIAELDAIGERVLTAQTLQEALTQV